VDKVVLAMALLVAASAASPAVAGEAARIKRGAYLVKLGGCSDCHAPLTMGPQGPMTDLSNGLSGHPAAMPVPPAPQALGPWRWGGLATNTAFWGPWGISFAANLTPDRETGIGAWSLDSFVKAMRTGRHLGVGRPILPPMPWRSAGSLDAADLRAMFAYLQSQPAVRNPVPEPVPPAAP